MTYLIDGDTIVSRLVLAHSWGGGRAISDGTVSLEQEQAFMAAADGAPGGTDGAVSN